MKNNYLQQAQNAQTHFLTYDQEEILARTKVKWDETYFYPTMLGVTYRLHRKTGNLEKRQDEKWVDGNTHGEVMTLLDWLCDSKPNRHLSGQWAPMQSFGQAFHQNLLEEPKNPFADKIHAHPEQYRQACESLGGKAVPGGDIGFAIELFDGLSVRVLFWFGDEEFAPQLRFYWDKNALSYLRYETMYFAVGLLTERLVYIFDSLCYNSPWS